MKYKLTPKVVQQIKISLSKLQQLTATSSLLSSPYSRKILASLLKADYGVEETLQLHNRLLMISLYFSEEQLKMLPEWLSYIQCHLPKSSQLSLLKTSIDEWISLHFHPGKSSLTEKQDDMKISDS